MSGLKLYSYFRSSTAYRVRIALNLKGLQYDIAPVHLLRGGGEQHSPGYVALNPQRLVPTLVDGDLKLGQSLAIIEYLDERFPEPPLLPGAPAARARARQLALAIACEIHAPNNLCVLTYLRDELRLGAAHGEAWRRHWLTRGFDAVERLIGEDGGRFCVGDAATVADICLVPQLYNARRHGFALDAYPNMVRVDAACRELEAFRAAAPEVQPDAERV